MKKKLFGFLFAFMICVPMMFLVAACDDKASTPETPTETYTLSVNSDAVRKIYTVGNDFEENFNSANLLVYKNSSAGSSETVANYQLNIAGVNTAVAGEYEIGVSYEGLSASFVVEMVELSQLKEKVLSKVEAKLETVSLNCVSMSGSGFVQYVKDDSLEYFEQSPNSEGGVSVRWLKDGWLYNYTEFQDAPENNTYTKKQMGATADEAMAKLFESFNLTEKPADIGWAKHYYVSQVGTILSSISDFNNLSVETDYLIIMNADGSYGYKFNLIDMAVSSIVSVNGDTTIETVINIKEALELPEFPNVDWTVVE